MYALGRKFNQDLFIGLQEKCKNIFPTFQKNLPIASDRNWRHCSVSKFKISLKIFWQNY